MSVGKSEKIVYFVRHGETVANQKHRRPGPHEPLGERGKEQAAKVALTLRELGVDTVLSSNFTRARETAAIICGELDVPYITTDEVVEFRRPNYIYGRSHYSFASFWYVAQLFLNQKNVDWDDDGAENLFHVHQRMKNAMRLIEETPGNRIAVVSHAIFMDMLTQMICADRDITLSEFTKGLVLTKKISNTGLITFSIDMNAPGQTCKWWYHGIGLDAARAALE